MATYRRIPRYFEAFRYGHDPVPPWFQSGVESGEIVAEERMFFVIDGNTVTRGLAGDYVRQGNYATFYVTPAEQFESQFEKVTDERP